MNTLTLSCTQCAAPFAAQSQRAKYCSASCRAKAHRQRPAATPATPSPSSAPSVGAIEAAAAEKLEPVQGLDAVTRAALLGIARRLDDPGTPGGAVATLNRELHRCFKELDIQPPELNAVGEARLSAAEKLAALAGARP